jgi:hypothetical protein
VRKHQKEVVMVLLDELGADVHMKDDDGEMQQAAYVSGFRVQGVMC